MKKWGVGVGVALILLIGSVGEARAQVVVTTTTNPNFSDSLVCPNGCEATVVVATTQSGDNEREVLTGAIYTEVGTNNAIPAPGGYSLALLSAYSKTLMQPTTSGVGQAGGEADVEGTLRTMGVEYAPGQFAGFYKAPNDKYYPIDTSKKATRHWKGKGVEAPQLNCEDSMQPYFGEGAELETKCLGGKLPTGNRVKYTGFCNPHEAWGEIVYDRVVTITSTCTLKCPDPGTEFVGSYKYICSKQDEDNCWNKLVGFKCVKIGVAGTVYYDELNACFSFGCVSGICK